MIPDGAPILQSDMDSLAVLATDNLLPLINAIIAANPSLPDNYGSNVYDKYTGGVVGYDNVNPVSPQPNYTFTARTFTNLISSATYSGTGSYNLTTTSSGDYDLKLGANDVSITVDGKTYTTSSHCVYIESGSTIMLVGTPSASVTARVGLSLNWLAEFNRIWADVYSLFQFNFTEGDGGMFINNAMLLSGPWVVGVNDQDTYSTLTPGVLNASAGVNFSKFCIFKDVSFAFRDADAPAGFSISSKMNIPAQTNTIFTINPSLFNFTWSTTQGGTLTMTFSMEVRWVGFGIDPGLTNTSGFVLMATPSTGVTWSVVPNPAFNPNNGGNSPPFDEAAYLLVCTIVLTVAAGDSGSINFSMTPPTHYVFNWIGTQANAIPITWSASLPLQSSNSRSAINALLPSGSASVIAVPESGGDHQQLIVNNIWADVSWTLSDPIVKGVWMATTLPPPGNNCFIDQDIPPYVGAVLDIPTFDYDGSALFIGVAGNRLTTGDLGNPYASTMRQAAPLGTSDIVAVLPSLQPQSTQWLMRRDLDFVPFNLGFNLNYTSTVYANMGAGSNYNITVSPVVTGIKIRLIQKGSIPGWSKGVFQYGVALPVNLRIFVRQAGFASPSSYDFLTNNNAVTIPNDGGLGYLQTVLNDAFYFYIDDPTDSGISFDVLVELETGVPTRKYFPCDGNGKAAAECYSYSLPVGNIQPSLVLNTSSFAVPSPSNVSKPVPQSGYCIFKVRATRMPLDPGTGILAVPATGSEIVITLGQNVLKAGPPSPFTAPPGMGGPFGFGMGMGGGANMGMGGQIGVSSLVFQPFKNPDGSNLTITIPAISSTTGDVAVFIPCIEGNEVVWQGATMVKMEAWANWQPIFFNNMYAQGQYPFDVNNIIGTNEDIPIFIPYCFNLLNGFDPTVVGWTLAEWPGSSLRIPSRIQWPVDARAYNDLEAMLNLIT